MFYIESLFDLSTYFSQLKSNRNIYFPEKLGNHVEIKEFTTTQTSVNVDSLP